MHVLLLFQASEFATQPAIKSVHLFGNPYDRFSLQELSTDGPQTPMVILFIDLFQIK